LLGNKQFDAAENAASRAIDLLPEKGQGYTLCDLHRTLGKIHQFKGEKGKAIQSFSTALEIASPVHWNDHLSWIHLSLARLFHEEGEFDDAHAHIERAKSHAVNDPYTLGRAIETQADFWYQQRRLEEAKSGALTALANYEKLGAARDAEGCRDLLQIIERAIQKRSSNSQGGFPETMIHLTSVNFHFLA
jgi:tetratricopeptide (TPR) repeat protein